MIAECKSPCKACKRSNKVTCRKSCKDLKAFIIELDHSCYITYGITGEDESSLGRLK